MLEGAPEFVRLLTEKYGTGQDFWAAYESDGEKEARLQMGVEGPNEIADRVNYALQLQNQVAQEYHRANPGQRLIVWMVGHYDSLSPFIKKHVLGLDPTNTYLPVEYGGGITIKTKNGHASCTLGGQVLDLTIDQ